VTVECEDACSIPRFKPPPCKKSHVKTVSFYVVICLSCTASFVSIKSFDDDDDDVFCPQTRSPHYKHTVSVQRWLIKRTEQNVLQRHRSQLIDRVTDTFSTLLLDNP